MKKLLLEGSIASGKTTLCQRLNGLAIEYNKTMELKVINGTIDTPGEYLEYRGYWRNLVSCSVECDLVVFVQDATSERFMYSPGASGAYAIPAMGVITKIDIATEEQIMRAREILELTGAKPIFEVSAMTGEGMEELMEYLK